MARTPEGRVEDHLVKRCRELGLMCLKTAAPGTRGMPDRLVLGRNDRGDAVSLHIEVKAPGATPRPSQVQLIARMRAQGAHVVVADTTDGVDALLEDYFLHTPAHQHDRDPEAAPLSGRAAAVLVRPVRRSDP